MPVIRSKDSFCVGLDREFRIAFDDTHLQVGGLFFMPNAGTKANAIAKRPSILSFASLKRTRDTNEFSFERVPGGVND